MVGRAQKGRRFFGRGIYTVPEAARLLALPSAQLRRWAAGYDFTYRGAPRFSKPLIHGEFKAQAGVVELSFLDLVELLFIKTFHDRGVSLPVIRLTAAAAADLLGSDHPFCNQRFRTDGHTVFAKLGRSQGLDESELSETDWRLIDLRTGQHEFHDIVTPFLHRFEYDLQTDLVRRWWPMGRNHKVVVDPAVNFGSPVVSGFGVATRLLGDARKSGRSVEALADWHGLPVGVVKEAIAFEDSLAKAA